MLLAIVLAYCIGSIPFALLLTKRVGVDLRHVGSGNLGATNVMRAVGPATAAAVAALDIAKGAVAVLIGQRFGGDATTLALAGLAAVLGHMYPVWLRFRGGKGVAAAYGVFLVLAPSAALLATIVFAALVWTTKYVSAGSVVAAIVVPPLMYATGSSPPVVTVAGAIAILIIFSHRSNLTRLRTGTERRLSLGQR